MRLSYSLSAAIILVFVTACARTFPIGSLPPPDHATVTASRHVHGYRLTLRDGRTEFIDEPTVYKTKAGKRGPLLAFSGKGFALAVQVDHIDSFERVDGTAKATLSIPAVSAEKTALRIDQSLAGSRRALFDPVCGTDGCFGGGGTCNAAQPQCNTCPDCSVQLPSVGDPINCYDTSIDPYSSASCGDDGRGRRVGVGLIPADPETTCLYDFLNQSLDCSYNNANPQPSRPTGNLNIGYLHSGFSVRMGCNIAGFIPLPVVGFAVYKDSSQVYTKSREADLNPDYWFVPDETGKPIPPPPPAHTSISAQYEYLGMPIFVAGHCDGND